MDFLFAHILLVFFLVTVIDLSNGARTRFNQAVDLFLTCLLASKLDRFLVSFILLDLLLFNFLAVMATVSCFAAKQMLPPLVHEALLFARYFHGFIHDLRRLHLLESWH